MVRREGIEPSTFWRAHSSKPTTTPITCGCARPTTIPLPPASPPDTSRAATFVGFKDGETLFVERVRDAPGGLHGEVSVTKGSVCIRYHVACC